MNRQMMDPLNYQIDPLSLCLGGLIDPLSLSLGDLISPLGLGGLKNPLSRLINHRRADEPIGWPYGLFEWTKCLPG